jgi:beta-lactam-binding protein with PASTA domain
MKNDVFAAHVKISSIIDTKPDAGNGRGMLGFVITFPDGRMQNKVMDYVKEDYDIVLKKINALHKKMVARYRC